MLFPTWESFVSTIDVTSASWKQLIGQAIATNEIPAGALMDFAGTAVPTGWLACDGSNYATATYPVLSAALGTTWGAPGGGNFTVPDFRRRVAVGSGGSGTGTLGNAVGNTGGAETHTLVSGESPSHQHFTGGDGGGGGTFGLQGTAGGGPFGGQYTDFAGGGGAHNNMQPSAIVLKIIKT
jgi:microcystin-dependent protein